LLISRHGSFREGNKMRLLNRPRYVDRRLILAALSVAAVASKSLAQQIAIGGPDLGNGWDSASAITVTASSSDNSSYLPENTVLGDDNSHDPNLFDSSSQFIEGPQATNTPAYSPSIWISGTVAQSQENPDPTGITSYSHWIEFSFNQSYSLGDMWIWNGNQEAAEYNYDDQGLEDVTIQYSDNGTTWTTASTTPVPEATNIAGSNLYSGVSQIVNFNGAQVKDVVITAAPANYNYSNGASQNVALSGARFFLANQTQVQVPAPLSSPPNRPFYYGYYFAETSVYGDYMDKQMTPAPPGSPYGTRLYDYTNLTLILDDTRYGSPDPHRTLVDAANLGYKMVVYGAGFTPGQPSTWNAGFAQLAQCIAGYQQNVYALDLVDEPNINGWSVSQEEALASAAETYFGHSVPITMNLYNPSPSQVPNNLDVYMFDDYINTSGTTTFAQYTSATNSYLNAIRANESGKQILLLGDSFGGGGYGFPSLAQQEWYYNTAVSNSDVGGLMWFMMGNASNNNPPLSGAISSPTSIAFQQLLGQTLQGTKATPALDERFDEYSTQSQLAAAYSGLTPALTAAQDHGSNGGNSAVFGFGSVNAIRQVSATNETGSYSAYLYNNLSNFGQYIGLRAVNAQGDSIEIYSNGATPDYYVVDQENNVTALDTGTATINDDWQKVQFSFNGSGVGVYVDGQLVYQAAGGWTGGFSWVGFYDPGGTTNVAGYVDDMLVDQNGPTTITGNNCVGPGDGQTWDNLQQNFNDGPGTTYADGEAVLFNDQNNGHYAVTLNSTVNPNNVAFYNSLGNYTLSGTGSIAGTGVLAKYGTGTATISTVNIYTGGTSVSAGKLIFAAPGALPNGAVAITGGTLQLAPNVGLAQMTSLSISGSGMLDVNNNEVILSYTGASPVTTIAGYLASGFNNGNWNGPGIMSTAAQSLTNGLHYGLGYADGADGVVAGLSSGQIEIKYTLLGDANLDGVVNGSDFSILAANFGTGATNWDQGNFLYGSSVNGSDFSALAANFGQGDSGAATRISASDLTALDAFALANGLPLPILPEPASLGLVSLCGLALNVRRRRRGSYGDLADTWRQSAQNGPMNYQFSPRRFPTP
jgi:autotransporter-associated beta strand protein